MKNNFNHYKVEFLEYDNGQPCIDITRLDGTEPTFTITICEQEDENAPECDLGDFAEKAGKDRESVTLLDNDIEIPQAVLDNCVEVLGVTWADPWANGGCKYRVAAAKFPCGTVRYVSCPPRDAPASPRHTGNT